MHPCRRALAPGELDHELLWLLISLGALIVLAGWFAARWPTPPCFFQAVTGLPCVTCGATRSAYQFLHGHFVASFLFNPLAFLAYCGLIAFDLYALGVLLTRSPRLRLHRLTQSEKTFLRRSVFILLGANWLYLLITQSA